MYRSLLLLAFLAVITHSIRAQEAPQLLRDGVSCLSAKDFLPPSNASAHRFGYWLDINSYPGQKVLYLVQYQGPTPSPGWVFTIVVSKHDGRTIFDIQNNAKFVRVNKGGEYKDVSFPEPPLGGIWTQEHIAEAIRQIARKPSYSLSGVDLRPLGSECRSYADKRR